MRYASVCDGIGAVHVAWHDRKGYDVPQQGIGWQCAWTAEIEPFPAAVVEHHWRLPNLGDMTKITEEQLEQHGPIDVLVGGTPCQSFSVAGLRKGLADPRGNLALVFLRLVDQARPAWVVWENVPGVLSSTSGEPEGAPPDRVGVGPGEQVVDEIEYDETSDFGCFTAALAELGYGFAYRVLNSVGFGTPQLRRRVFVVGHLGGWRGPFASLFQREALRGDLAAGEEAAAALATAPHLRPPGRVVGFTSQLGTQGGDVYFDVSPTVRASHPPAIAWSAKEPPRVLSCVEVERLMGFPDNYTRIPYRKKPAEACPDGPRYKALGNSMVVPVMRWIGQRIAEVENIVGGAA